MPEIIYDLTIRQRVINEMTRRLGLINPQAGNLDGKYWTKVFKTSPARKGYDKILAPVIAIYDRNETYIYEAGSINCNLRVQVEFFLMIEPDADASAILEVHRLWIINQINRDLNLTEAGSNVKLCLGVHVASSDKNVDGPRDRLVDGYVEFEVLYRHSKYDPTKFP